ncbi:MAG TPA: alpha/beta hydrolase-fold protein [Hyphomicrobiales bacterium]|nr:alpha/beta hydrolase-fold protein [Hyphomicrobiales bacterium]
MQRSSFTTLRNLVTALLASLYLASSAFGQGSLELIQVEGASLAGNLEGDATLRDVYVYLPPGYADAPAKRYPVVYFLHGYGATAQRYVEGVLDLPAGANRAIEAGAAEAIVVVPDAYTLYGGSMYSNSLATGDWEGFIANDLVAYIDSHYRTLATRESRGLSGHSMGGYGALRIGMKYPQTFGALYAMSSCCLMNQAPSQQTVQQQEARMAEGPITAERGFTNVAQAQAVAWAANPHNPPYYFDWPWRDGEPQPLVQARWAANSPLVFVDQYVPALKHYRAIMLDVGDQDSLAASNRQLDAELTRLGVEHGFEVYEGDHGNRIGERFQALLLPYFSRNLDAQ